MNNRQSPFARERSYGALRTLLISYGVAAFAFLSSRAADAPTALGTATSAQDLVVIGLAAQLLLVAARWLLRRRLSDRTAIAQATMALEIVGDGVTVLLFALATLGPIIFITDNI